MITISKEAIDRVNMKYFVYTMYEYIESGMPEDKEKFLGKTKFNKLEENLFLKLTNSLTNKGYLVRSLLEVMYADLAIKNCIEENRQLSPALFLLKSRIGPLSYEFTLERFSLKDKVQDYFTKDQINRYNNRIESIFRHLEDDEFWELKSSKNIKYALRYFKPYDDDSKLQKQFVLKLLEDVNGDAKLAASRIKEVRYAFNELSGSDKYLCYSNKDLTDSLNEMEESKKISKESKSVLLSLYRFYLGINKGYRIRSYGEAVKRGQDK